VLGRSFRRREVAYVAWAETREYVPKVLAAVIVSGDAKKLGLE
jgi:hypothetical protein